MRICVLAISLRTAGGRAVGQGIIGSLARVAPQHEYHLIVPAGVGYEPLCERFPRATSYVHRPHGGRVGRLLFERRKLPELVREARPDVILSLDMRGLLDPPCPQVVFPQDSHLFYPIRHYGRESWRIRMVKAYDKRYLRRLLPAVSLVLCQTKVVEQRIRDVYGYRGEAFVCGSAVSSALCNDSSDSAVPQPLVPFADRFKLLSIGRYYAHKNLDGLIGLFHNHPAELDQSVVFVTVAPDHHPRAGRFLRRVERAGLADRIVNLGPIPPDEVGRYYRQCDAMLMPTLLETFGLPYLEAMHCGLPILTSALDFAREVCGDAAEFFDPWDTASIAAAIQRIRTDPSRRDELIAHGRARIRDRFETWDQITSRIVGRLETLGAEPGVSHSQISDFRPEIPHSRSEI